MFRRVLLVKPSGRKGLGFASDLIPIGLEYIAAAIEDVVDDVSIVDMELEEVPFQYFLNSFRPDLVGITMSATDHDEGLRIAKIAKEYGCTTVLGGYHPTTIPDELLCYSEVDLIVRGEGELTMRELVQKDSPKYVLGLSYKEDGKTIHNGDRPFVQDLDSLPFPARHLRRHRYKDRLAIDRKRERDVITMSRGCLGRCSFCCEPAMNKGYQRFRSPENVMRELLEMESYHRGSPLYIFVTDPNFMGSPKRIDRLCDLLHEHQLDVRFSVLVRADSVVRNPELVAKMCENGILNYEIGIESPKAEDLRNMKKGITLEMQEKAVRILKDKGGWVGGTFVIGLPGQTEEEIKKFPIYAKKIGLSGAAFGILTPFPGTELYREFERDDLIVDHDWSKYDEMHSVFESKNITKERLEELATYCHAKFWTLDRLIERTRVDLKPGEKVSLEDFAGDMLDALNFGWNVASDSQTDRILTHMRIAAEAGADPCVEQYTREVGVHNVIELSWLLLRVLGQQVIQFTVTCKGVPVTSYIIETTGSSVKYVRAIQGKQECATIDLNIELYDLDLSGAYGPTEFLENCVRATASLQTISGTWCRLRLFAGLGLESTRLIVFQKVKALERMGSSIINGKLER
jgi:radical SAM superfamily enzyme YgiQ (UPF0313 family)